MEECYRKWEELEKISGQSLYRWSGQIGVGVIPINFPSRKTGVLVIGPEAGQSLTEFRVTIQHAGVSHEILNSSQLRANYPGLTFPADYVALLEYDGGTLRADKCLSAYQVRNLGS